MAWGVDQMYELAGAYATAWASWLCIGNFGMGLTALILNLNAGAHRSDFV